MLALVCQTFDGVKALEAYDEGGVINRNSGLHGIASSTGRTLEGRFDHVICLDELMYVGICPLLLPFTTIFYLMPHKTSDML